MAWVFPIRIWVELALADAVNGGNGRANATLALSLNRISQAYSGLPLEERNKPYLFDENRLDETVAAVLEGISVPKYQRIVNPVVSNLSSPQKSDGEKC